MSPKCVLYSESPHTVQCAHLKFPHNDSGMLIAINGMTLVDRDPSESSDFCYSIYSVDCVLDVSSVLASSVTFVCMSVVAFMTVASSNTVQ